MAVKHNRWMAVLQAVLSALASLFGSLKLKQEDISAEAESDTTTGE